MEPSTTTETESLEGQSDFCAGGSLRTLSYVEIQRRFLKNRDELFHQISERGIVRGFSNRMTLEDEQLKTPT